jgi:hypothetical protein
MKSPAVCGAFLLSCVDEFIATNDCSYDKTLKHGNRKAQKQKNKISKNPIIQNNYLRPNRILISEQIFNYRSRKHW